jgi:hypothetical protein
MIKNKAILKLDTIKAELEKFSVLEDLISVFQGCSAKISRKIREAVQKYAAVKSRLQGMAEIPIKNEESIQVFNPLDQNHLPGVLYLIYDSYRKKTFVTFASSLLEAMSWSLSEEDTNENPVLGTQQVFKIYSSWVNRGLWAQMSMDIFFTTILIRGLHPNSKLRGEAITKVTEFVTEAVKKGELNVDSNKLVIYNQLTDFISVDQANKKFNKKNSKVGSEKVENYDKSKQNTSNNKSTGSDKTKTNVESAHAADATKGSGNTPPQQSANTKSNTGTPPSSQKFKAAVTKDMNVRVISGHRKNFPYLAVLDKTDICNKCFLPNGVVAKEACSAKGFCYQGQCNRCQYFGHIAHNCLQLQDVAGNTLPSN